MGFVVPRRAGGYVAGVGRSIVAVDWSTQTMTSLVEVDGDKPNNRLNDGKVDPIGRLLAGQSGHLSVYPSVYSIYRSVYLSTSLFTCLSGYWSVYLSGHLSSHLSVYLPF